MIYINRCKLHESELNCSPKVPLEIVLYAVIARYHHIVYIYIYL